MTDENYIKPKTFNPPDGKKSVWCPFCDWHMTDSMTARKRMGQHLTDRHPEEVWFDKGKEPPDLEKWEKHDERKDRTETR